MTPRRSTLSAFDARRSELIGRLAEMALADGFGRFMLRDLATALRTSDRMLLYYFKTKSDLVLAVLQRISVRLAEALSDRDMDVPLPPDRFLARALAQLEDPAVAPLVRVWAEVVARGAQGEEPFRQAADAAIGQWLTWISARLDLPEDVRRGEPATALLALIEGVTLLEMVRPGSTTGAAGFVRELLGRPAG